MDVGVAGLEITGEVWAAASWTKSVQEAARSARIFFAVCILSAAQYWLSVRPDIQ